MQKRMTEHCFINVVFEQLSFLEWLNSKSSKKEWSKTVQQAMRSSNVNKKLVVNRLSELVSKYYVAHAQQENVQNLAEPTSSSKHWQKKEI